MVEVGGTPRNGDVPSIAFLCFAKFEEIVVCAVPRLPRGDTRTATSSDVYLATHAKISEACLDQNRTATRSFSCGAIKLDFPKIRWAGCQRHIRSVSAQVGTSGNSNVATDALLRAVLLRAVVVGVGRP